MYFSPLLFETRENIYANSNYLRYTQHVYMLPQVSAYMHAISSVRIKKVLTNHFYAVTLFVYYYIFFSLPESPVQSKGLPLFLNVLRFIFKPKV
jgi:hypothetical protein